ncbi:TPA: hypothetical protein ACH3X2_000638 [Trebouxia sp. C0005]
MGLFSNQHARASSAIFNVPTPIASPAVMHRSLWLSSMHAYGSDCSEKMAFRASTILINCTAICVLRKQSLRLHLTWCLPIATRPLSRQTALVQQRVSFMHNLLVRTYKQAEKTEADFIIGLYTAR